MNEALLLYGLFSLFMLRPFFGPKDPMLQSISPSTRRELLKGQYPEAIAELTATLSTDSANATPAGAGFRAGWSGCHRARTGRGS